MLMNNHSKALEDREPTIKFCPLHAAAEEMRDVLKALRGSINLILNRYAHDLREQEKEMFLVANRIAGNLIARTEGRYE